MSVPNFAALERHETLEGKQAAAREVLADGVAMGPRQQEAEGLYSYGLSPACAHYLDLALSEMAKELAAWAGQHGKRVTSTTILDKHPETFRLEAGHAMVTPNDNVAVVLPLSGAAVDVEIKGDGAEPERSTWKPEMAMLVDTGKAFSLVEGNTHLIYILVRVQAAAQ